MPRVGLHKARQVGRLNKQFAVGHASSPSVQPRVLFVKRGGTGLQASLAKLNELLGKEQAVPMERFRPNVVVAGTQAWEEDDWETYTLSGPAHSPCKFSATMPCDRCKARLLHHQHLPGTFRVGMHSGGF